MGAEQEIEKLLGAGYHWDNSVMGTTIGYRQWREYFEGKASKEEVVKRWQFAEHDYARRQMTFFRKMTVSWFKVPVIFKAVEKEVSAWYS
jgi:tRNA dimethylallyltransferase